MKKIVLLLIIFLAASNVSAQAFKTITLKDGSVIRGQILSMSNGEYQVQSDTIGVVTVSDKEIRSISDGIPTKSADVPINMSDQMEAMQMTILSDPQMMEQIQALMTNESIMQIIQDPKLMQDLMSMDEETIQNNPQIKKLLSDPQMKSIIEAAEKKFSE